MCTSARLQAKTFCEVATLHPKDIKTIIEDDDELHKRLHRYVELKQRLADLSVIRLLMLHMFPCGALLDMCYTRCQRVLKDMRSCMCS